MSNPGFTNHSSPKDRPHCSPQALALLKWSSPVVWAKNLQSRGCHAPPHALGSTCDAAQTPKYNASTRKALHKLKDVKSSPKETFPGQGDTVGPLHRFDSCSVLPKHIGWERGIQQGSSALPLSNTQGKEPRSPPFTATPLTATPLLSAQLLGALLMAAHCERFSHNFNLMSSQSWGKKEGFTTFVKRKCPNNAENSMYDCF